MEKMEVDNDAVVDLSVKRETEPSNETGESPQDLTRAHRLPDATDIILGESQDHIPRSRKEFDDRYPRRNLRPRMEKNYAESPDVIVLSDEEPRINGYTNGYDSDTSEGEMPPLLPIKELSPSELQERERGLRKLREELRNEEMKLVLLKKLRQSQQMKENIAVIPPSQQVPTTNKPPTSAKLPPPTQQPPPSPSLARTNHSKQPSPSMTPPMSRGQPWPRSDQRSGAYGQMFVYGPHSGGRTSAAPGMPSNLLTAQQSMQRSGSNPRTPPNVAMSSTSQDRTPKEAHHSPASNAVTQQAERMRVDDNQTPAQRQAAAKLALRKQLEKTLLQIPPPKPPPPEMHFIPNPSNTEFIYLLGLEHVVDFITKDHKTPPPPDAFKCSQCLTDFTPVWKWEKNPAKGKEPKVICEQCVTTNVKKALKAEHTNRLKTAFVKALQQEQEIEQRLAQVSNGSPQPPEPPPPAMMSAPAPKAAARHAPTPPAPPPTPPLSHREHPLVKLAAESNKFGNHHAAAAALHQQLLRNLPQHQPLPAHMLPFSPLLYPYQLAMAQAAGGKAAAANLVELQRQAADLQRQYLLDMIPSSPSQSRSHHNQLGNWKT